MASLKWCAAAFALIASGSAVPVGAYAQLTPSPSPPSPACPPPACFERPVTTIVPFAAGGGTDQAGRAWAQALSKALNQPVVVENAVGAGGVIGLDKVAKARPDSHTLLFTSPGPVTVMQHLVRNFPVDPAKDLVPAAMVGTVPQLLVVPADSPFKSVRDLLVYARANPGKVNFGSGGNGTLGHLIGQQLATTAGVQMVHVPYKGIGQAINEVVGKQLQFAVTDILSVESHLQGGRLRALAITGERRFSGLPNVPTFGQQEVRGLENAGWLGVFFPAGTPPSIASRLAIENAKILADPQMQERFVKAGVQPTPMAPGDFARYVEGARAQWGKLVRDANIKAD